MVIEPTFADTYWCNLCLQGIRSEASRNKLIPQTIDLSDTSLLQKLAAEPRPLVILVGSLCDWIRDSVRTLDTVGIHAITVTAPLHGLHHVSTVSIDHWQAISALFAHLQQTGAERIALFGVHPNSVNDLDKLKAFCECTGQQSDAADDIYWNNGHVTALCQDFCNAIDRYDAVLCANDILAIRLKDAMLAQGISIPNHVKLATVGETRLAHLVKPGITSAVLNFQDIGRHAIKLYRMLQKNPDLTALHATVHADIIVRESTGSILQQTIPVPPVLKAEHSPDFYEDEEVRRIFRLENLISHCLPVDFSILKGLSAGCSYQAIAESNFIAENTLKYRIRRMQELSDTSSRDALLALIHTYLPDIPEK